MEKLITKYDGLHFPRAMRAIERLGGADDCDTCEDMCNNCHMYCKKCPIQQAFERLAEYEATDITPEQIIELKKQIPPCKVGDTVYVKMQSGEYAEAEVRDLSYFLSCGFCIVVTSDKFDKQHIPFTEFGKTVFLTKTEAEEALKRMEDRYAGSI